MQEEQDGYFTYVLFAEKHARFYIGQTRDIKERLERHNAGLVSSTKAYVPWQLIGFIEKQNRAEAMKLEKKLKNLNKTDLQKFIQKYFSK